MEIMSESLITGEYRRIKVTGEILIGRSQRTFRAMKPCYSGKYKPFYIGQYPKMVQVSTLIKMQRVVNNIGSLIVIKSFYRV